MKSIALDTRLAHGVRDLARRATTEAGVAPVCVRTQAPREAPAIAGDLRAEAHGALVAQGRREIVRMPRAVRATPTA